MTEETKPTESAESKPKPTEAEAQMKQAAAPTVNVEDIVEQVNSKIDVNKIKRSLHSDIVGSITEALNGKKEEKVNPLHAAFVNTPEDFTAAILAEAEERAVTKIRTENDESSAMWKVVNEATKEYPGLVNLPGEIVADYGRIEKSNPKLSKADIMKKSLPETIKRLEGKGLVKKISPEDAAAMAGHLPGSRSVPMGVEASGGADLSKSTNDFIQARASQLASFRVKAT